MLPFHCNEKSEKICASFCYSLNSSMFGVLFNDLAFPSLLEYILTFFNDILLNMVKNITFARL